MPRDLPGGIGQLDWVIHQNLTRNRTRPYHWQVWNCSVGSIDPCLGRGECPQMAVRCAVPFATHCDYNFGYPPVDGDCIPGNPYDPENPCDGDSSFGIGLYSCPSASCKMQRARIVAYRSLDTDRHFVPRWYTATWLVHCPVTWPHQDCCHTYAWGRLS